MDMYNKLFSAGILLGMASLSMQAQEKDNKPLNIVFIMSDDHSYQMVSCYDQRYISTPNIDRIAADGARFTNSFVANSLSGPSRACLITGKHSCGNGFYANDGTRFDGSQQTFPKLLQAAGYQTALIGKWHLGSNPTGFDHWEILPGQGDYFNPVFITEEGRARTEGYVTDIIADKAIGWMEERDPQKPFCILIHNKAPHRNWMSDLQDLEAYEDREFPLPDNFYDDYQGRIPASRQEMSIAKDINTTVDLKIPIKEDHPGISRMTEEQKERWVGFYSDLASRTTEADREDPEWKYQRYMRDYMKVINSVDRNVGRVLDYLEANGLMENTLVVYTSDQGFYMGEHGWFDKRFMYEESFRTPLVMRLPGDKARKGDIPQMVQNIDLAPTFLEAAGVEIPADIHGTSMLPLLRGEKRVNWRKSLYYHYYEYPAVHSVRKHYGVRTDRYKLIHFYDDIDCWELYDLKKDPSEMNNLYESMKDTRTVRKLKEELAKLQKQYGDPVADSFHDPRQK